MKFLTAGILIGLCSAHGCYYPASKPRHGKEGTSISLKDLPGIHGYKIAPYVRAAAQLQQLGQQRACEELARAAPEDDEGQVTLLCRLLFCKKGAKTFRGPERGVPVCFGDTTNDDWPLMPLELVDGVPFLIVYSYDILGGVPESSLDYLNYCIENCDWSSTRFDQLSDVRIERAHQKLLASGKWKRWTSP